MIDMDEGQLEAMEAYRRAAGGYDRTVRLFDAFSWMGFSISGWRRMAVDALQLKPGARVMDIGCGTGLNFPLLEQAIGPQGSILGVDISAEMLERADKAVKAAGWSNIVLQQADASQFSYPEDLDGILSTYALTLVPNIARVASMACGALSPDGRLSILDMAWPDWLPLWGRHLLFFLRTYGVTKEVLEKRPWQQVEFAFRGWLKNVRLQSFWFGFFYLLTAESFNFRI